MTFASHNPHMSNIASILKSEIARVARKEIRAAIEPLKEASGQYRTSIASLKREILALEKRVKQLSKGAGRQPRAIPEDESEGKRRFSAKRLATHRAKLGLSAKDYGALLGVSTLTIYKWEKGQSRPRVRQLEAISNARHLGKREAAKQLQAAELV